MSGDVDVSNDWIETYSGVQFHLDPIRPDDILLEDIAESLSKQCRYNGHTQVFYSVAEHCVLMTRFIRLLPGREEDLTLAKTCLLHDASEAYTSDLPRPVKRRIGPEFSAFESEVQACIAKRFHLIHPAPSIIKHLDVRILLDERAAVMKTMRNRWATDGFEPLGITIPAWSPTEARDMFLKEYAKTL